MRSLALPQEDKFVVQIIQLIFIEGYPNDWVPLVLTVPSQLDRGSQSPLQYLYQHVIVSLILKCIHTSTLDISQDDHEKKKPDYA